MSQVPATSYSTIFHCTQSGFECSLRLFQGLVSLLMFLMFWKGYQTINRQRNNKLTKQDRQLYLLAMLLTLMLTVYYLLFEQFFMLATIRNLLIWIGINVLHIFCLLYWNEQKYQSLINKGMYLLQAVNLALWLFISLGEGSSLENSAYQLGYNCQVIDWMVMSAILLTINFFSAALGYFKINKLEWQVAQMKQQDATMNARKIASTERQRINILIMMGSGIIGSTIMFGWDFLAYNGAHDMNSCNAMFSGNTVFRNLLTFLLKIFTMQLNPTAIYYVMYYSRRNQFQQAFTERRLNEQLIDYFDDGASQANRTNSSVRKSDLYRQSSSVGRVASHYN